MKILSFTSLLIFAAAPTLFAQRATVQQPVFRNFSVNTTVSVPDRGSALLGSVSRAGSSRKSFGPGFRGSSRGMFREHSSARVHTYIHDFEAMDNFLLNQAQPTGHNLTGRTGNAYSQLSNRFTTHSSAEKYPLSRNIKTAASQMLNSAERSIQLGLKAEKKGKLSLAKLHFRMAAKKGSTTADEHLARISELKAATVASRK